ncbi:MAG TPA: hypothetical protein VKV15_16845 [Bryobacteraceae bacterium]|nr:hypothetical protein [Bryobacteraceae bacterium]
MKTIFIVPSYEVAERAESQLLQRQSFDLDIDRFHLNTAFGTMHRHLHSL